MKISVVIPVFNSEGSLEELYNRICKSLKKLTANYELILVDDCSRDNSWKILEKLHSADKKVKIFQLMKNFGQHNAIMCGLNFASGDFIVTLDDDLQHPPEEISKLFSAQKKLDSDVVYGKYNRKEHNLIRNLGTFFINYVLRKVTKRKGNITSFRIIKKIVVEKIIKHRNYNVMIDVCISNVVPNENVGYALISHQKRKYGKTNYSIRRLVSMGVGFVLNYSTLPLKIASLMGISFSVLSLVAAIILLVIYFRYQTHVSGWTSLVVAVIFFSGMILFVLGIIGEYISRIYLSLSNKPQFEVRQRKI